MFRYLELNNGMSLDLDDPQPEVMDIEQIAHSLAYQNRFCGQTNRFYSVADHSIAVSYAVPERHAYVGLMHDAAEAFFGDIAAPVKRLCPELKALELRIWAVLAPRYGLPLDDLPEEVHLIDHRMQITEAKALLNTDNWKNWWPGLEPLDIDIRPRTPRIAKQDFLRRFKELNEDYHAHCRAA